MVSFEQTTLYESRTRGAGESCFAMRRILGLLLALSLVVGPPWPTAKMPSTAFHMSLLLATSRTVSLCDVLLSCLEFMFGWQVEINAFTASAIRSKYTCLKPNGLDLKRNASDGDPGEKGSFRNHVLSPRVALRTAGSTRAPRRTSCAWRRRAAVRREQVPVGTSRTSSAVDLGDERRLRDFLL